MQSEGLYLKKRTIRTAYVLISSRYM